MMLYAALEYSTPVAIRYPKGAAATLPVLPSPIEKGRSVILREGCDMVYFAIGSMVEPCLLAAEQLAKAGVQAAVVNARFAAPLDNDTLFQVVAAAKGRIVTAEENVINGGFGAACAEALSNSGLNYDLHIAALPDTFFPHGNPTQQLAAFGLDAVGLAHMAGEKWFSERIRKYGSE